MKYHKTKIAAGAKIARQSVVIGDVTIGDDSCVLHFSVLRGDAAPIYLGDVVNVQENCTIHASSGHPVHIGDHVTIGHNAVVHGCTIGDNSLIGMGAIILDGAQIGKNCLIGAGALVTKGMIVPAGSLVLGSPAKIRRSLTEEEIEANYRTSLKYKKISEEMRQSGVL